VRALAEEGVARALAIEEGRAREEAQAERVAALSADGELLRADGVAPPPLPLVLSGHAASFAPY